MTNFNVKFGHFTEGVLAGFNAQNYEKLGTKNRFFLEKEVGDNASACLPIFEFLATCLCFAQHNKVERWFKRTF